MQSMTIKRLRAISKAGGVESVTLKGQGGMFLVQILTCSGATVLLVKARSNVPCRFANPIFALNVLRDVGITIGQFDVSEWSPAVKEEIAGNRGRAEAMRKALQVAYTEWLTAEIQEAIDDPRPSIPHDEVISWIDAHIFSSKDSGTARK